MKVINILGGPGTGKSTTAADLFALMKWKNYNVELVNEYAKEVTWENRLNILEDQLYILAKQNHKLWRIKDQVDYAITDSPLILSLAYAKEDYFPENFDNLVMEVWESYDNYNFFLTREKKYHQIGRSQTEDQARELDETIKTLMGHNWYGYTEVPGNENAKNLIFDIIKDIK